MKHYELNFNDLTGTFGDTKTHNKGKLEPFIYWSGKDIDDLIENTKDIIEINCLVDMME